MTSELITEHLLLDHQDGVTDPTVLFREPQKERDTTRIGSLQSARSRCRTATAVILVRVDGAGRCAVGGGGGDAEDDAVAVLDLEGEWLAWRAVSGHDAERAAEAQVEKGSLTVTV